MLLFLSLLPSFADQAEVGVSFIANDPFIRQKSISLAYGGSLSNHVVYQLNANYFLDLGSADYTPVSRFLMDNLSVAPDMSKLDWNTFLSVGIEPLNFSFDNIRSCFGVMIGAGVIQTKDDMDSVQADEEDVRFLSTQIQTHPLAVWTMYSSINFENWGISFHFDAYNYLEGILGAYTENKNPQVMSVRVFFPIGTLRVGQYTPEALFEQYKKGE